jgi:basic amino acid/polyamine antiporter, APA family
MTDRPALVRSIGRWSLAALVLNGIIGSGVFVQPGTIAGMLGWTSLLAWVLAALFTAAFIFTFAEVASRFTGAGGAYLYTQVAFGRFLGLQMGWMTYFVRAISAAVQVNLFTTYLAEFWPWAATRVGNVVLTTALIGILATINIRSVLSGARVSNAFALVKLTPLLLFGALGIAWLLLGRAVEPVQASNTSAAGWLGALLLLMFAYGGFESALIPLAEAKDPRRDAPFAMILGLALVTLVYLATQLTVLSTLTDPTATNRPLAASARVMLGEPGALAITAVAVLSVTGWLASNMLNVPRLTMAMAERGEMPKIFGRIHPVFRTPWFSILAFGVVSWILALQAGLLQNISLAAVSRLFTYGLVCAALPKLRRMEERGDPAAGQARFRVTGGVVLGTVGVLISLVLGSRMNLREAATLTVVVAIATVHWLVLRRREPTGVS